MNAMARDFADQVIYLVGALVRLMGGLQKFGNHASLTVFLIRNHSTVGRDSMDLVSRRLWIKRSVCSSAALSPVVLSMILLHSRERACTNGSLTIIGVNYEDEATTLWRLCIFATVIPHDPI